VRWAFAAIVILTLASPALARAGHGDRSPEARACRAEANAKFPTPQRKTFGGRDHEWIDRYAENSRAWAAHYHACRKR
jgi:hypothetical protein